MTRLISSAALGFILGVSQLSAQMDDPSVLKSRSPAQAWRADSGWLEGVIARVFPEGGGECVVFFSEDLGGFVGLGHLDSLRVRVQLPDSTQPSGLSDHRWYWLEVNPRIVWTNQLQRSPTCYQA